MNELNKSANKTVSYTIPSFYNHYLGSIEPYRMGSIQIVKKQPKHLDGRSLRIDYKATKELGKLTYLLNEHSGFYKYRLYWNKQDMLVSNKSKYQIVLTRANKRHLAQIIKQNIHDYEQQP